jgi:hypothetical protein
MTIEKSHFLFPLELKENNNIIFNNTGILI